MSKIVITVTNNISFDQRIIKIGQSLSKHYKVDVFGTNTRNPPSLNELKGPHGQYVGFRPKRINTLFNTGFLFYLEYNVRLFITLLFTKCDIIYAVDLDTLLAASLAAKIRRRVLVFDSHEFFTELPELQGQYIKKVIWGWIGKIGIKKSDLNITVNQSLAEILAKKYHTTFRVIRNMPAIMEIPDATSNDTYTITKPYFIYQGAINQGRGISEMIKMMSKFQEYQLVIAGSGPEIDNFKLQARNKTNIIFTGNIPYYKLCNLTAGAILGFNLLESESLNYYYSLANKFFDYTMAGIPSVNMEFPEYQRLNDLYEVAILLPNLEISNLVLTVKDILSDDIKLNELRSNCIKARVDWNWAKEELELIELFSSLQNY